MDSGLEKECSALGGLFQNIVHDLKGYHGVWEDLCVKSTKLHAQLRGTIVAVGGFLDALQRVADVASSAKGATRDIGTTLTRICIRHRSIENGLKTLTSALVECLVMPLQERMEEWRRCAIQMDRDHGKEYKRCKSDIKKRREDAARMQNKVRKGHSSMRPMLDSALQEINDRSSILLQSQRQAVRQALVEQRSQFCLFASWFKPILDDEVCVLNEAAQMQELIDRLSKQAADPYAFPLTSEAVITDIKGVDNAWLFQTPPSSPGSSYGSRKSSFCSLSSAESSFHQSSVYMGQHAAPVAVRHAVINADGKLIGCSSAQSQDSGFLSRDSLYPSKNPNSSSVIKSSAVECDNSQANSHGSTPSPSSSLATWPESRATFENTMDKATNAPLPVAVRPHTISASFTNAQAVRHRQLNQDVFLEQPCSQPPLAAMYKGAMQRPPLPIRLQQQATGKSLRAVEGARGGTIYYNCPVNTGFGQQGRCARPLSFAGTSDFPPPVYSAVAGAQSAHQRPSSRADDQGDLTPRANGCGLPPPPVFAGCVKRRSVAGRLPPPPPTRRNSSITSATPSAPAVDAVRSSSRSVTPVENAYSDVIYALNARLSTQNLNHSSETIMERNCEPAAMLSKSLQETFYSLPYADLQPNMAHLKGEFHLHQV